MASKPMLEFTIFPPRAEERPRRRRKALKTPKILKVRCVTIAGYGRQHHTGPCLETESQIRNAELEIAKVAKWVSPQFTEAEAGYRKRQRPLDLVGEQLFSNLQPSRTCQRRKLNLGLRRGKEGCARTRTWKKCGVVSTSQHVSLFSSAPSLTVATKQQSSPVPNPPPPHLTDCHLPSFHANVPSSGSISDNTDDLHNRAFERASHATDSGNAPIQSAAAEDPVPLETSGDTTYLEESSSLNEDVLNTDLEERRNIVDEHRTPENNASHSEVESHNRHGNTEQIAHTSDKDSTEEDSPSILQSPQRTSDLRLLTRLTTSHIHSPIRTQSFVNREFGTRHDTGLGKRSSCVHVPSLPLTPSTPPVSQPQATESWLNAETTRNSRCHQQDAHGLCVMNQSGVRSSFTHHNLSDLVANMSVRLYQGSNDNSTHRSESPVTTPDSVDLPTFKCREIKYNSSSVSDRFKACHISEPSHYQHHQNSRASFPSPQGVDHDFQGLRDVIQYSVDSTKLPTLRLEDSQSMNSSTDLSIGERDTQTVCDLQRFQPQSFSTPFQSTDESLDTSGVHSNQTEWKSRRRERGNDGTDTSSTRLDSHWTMNLSTTPPSEIPPELGYTAPSQSPVVLPAGSTHKSILKKTSRNASMLLDSCNGQASSGKGIAKCVTFNLSYNSSCSDESSVLAEDTPRHLWCSISSLPPNHYEDEIKEVVMDSEDVCAANGHGEVDEVFESHDNWQGHCCLDDRCILAMDTPVHMWASPSINFIEDTF